MSDAEVKSLKLFIKTYGCQMNTYDSDRIVETMRQNHGFEPTEHQNDADLIIFNTCSVREKAQEKLFSDIGRLLPLKKSRPNLVIAVGGCVASQEGDLILKRTPLVNIIFGPQTLHRLPALYAVHIADQNRKPAVDVSFPEIEKFDHLPSPKADGVKAYVTIMEGCSKFCSFCVVPYTRGREISRPFDDVLNEVARLHEQGVKEVCLLGQNVNDYKGRMHQGGYASLAMLIHYLAALDGIERIRFMTSHPKAFDRDLIEAYAHEPKLANQLHLPVQSGSSRILSLMKRGYTAEQFKEKIKWLRQVRPEISLTTDFIVGFPGETEEDFEQTMDLVKEVGFDSSYSFIYSIRPGTPASLIEDTVSLEEKKDRLNRLQTLLQAQYLTRSKSMVNTVHKVLIDGIDIKTKTHLVGRTECNRLVHINGPKDWIGLNVDVMITDCTPHAMFGRINDPSLSAPTLQNDKSIEQPGL